jgi:ADP-ribosylation factor GTPase-activating protein 1
MDKFSHSAFEQLMKEPSNRYCFDCNSPYPKWASLNHGIYICLNCAGLHRGLGVQMSFVRSITMDNW